MPEQIYKFPVKKWYWCDIKYACFGFSIENEKVKDAAPIFSWAIGKDLQVVRNWLKSKGAKVLEVK